jgi:hypothetical protein
MDARVLGRPFQFQWNVKVGNYDGVMNISLVKEEVANLCISVCKA